MARVLVGIPCFRIFDQVCRCLLSLINTPADVVAVDNAADVNIKMLINAFEYSGKIKVIRNLVNEYCNGAWNRILEHGLNSGYDIIGLGSSDAFLHEGWYEVLQDRFSKFTDEVWIPKLGEPTQDVEYVTGGIAGYFSFLTRKAAEIVYPIHPVGK